MGDATTARSRQALMGLFFFPRGGSAYVARALADGLPSQGWHVSLAAGSLGPRGATSNAATFFNDPSVVSVEIGPGAEPGPRLPFLPSYEDTGAPGELVMARVDDATTAEVVAAWREALRRAGAADAELLHLHHLTPLHEAAALEAPGRPVVAQLHGTELRLLERIREGPPCAWLHARAWEQRMVRWARSSTVLLVPSEAMRARAATTLGVAADAIEVLPHGVDLGCFHPRRLGRGERLALWGRWLVEEPRGWLPGAEPGSLAYREEELDAFRQDGPVLLFVGRFTEAKRVPLLLRALVRARRALASRVPLVLVGGFPGESEGPHPLEAIEALGVRDVFLAGWHSPQEVAEAMNAADLLVLPSAAESFGLVLAEAMACGLPVIASDQGGQREIVEEGVTGWLFAADDEDRLVEALVAALGDDEERRRRGAQAAEQARSHYGWPAVAGGLAALYDRLVPARRRPRAS